MFFSAPSIKMGTVSKNEIINLIKELKRVIRLNKHVIISSELEDALTKLPKLINTDKCGPYYVYTDLLAQLEELIDNFNIDVNQINKSIRNQFKQYHENQSSEDREDGENDEDDENNGDSEDDVANKKESTMYNKIMNNLNTALEKALMTNNEELINSTIKLINTLVNNQLNIAHKINIKQTTTSNNIHVDTPKWLKDSNCSVNPKIKKDDPEALKYAIALSQTKAPNRNRPKNIALNFKHFKFNNMNSPPTKEDYETFEKNNESVKLTVLKLSDVEKQLHFHYNDEDRNQRSGKVVVILLENNHYIYVTKLKPLTKYIICN